MRKITIFLFAFLFTGFHLFSQGIAFEELSLEQALQKARDESKMVFIDCYTAWCGPCKLVAAQVFPTKEAGDFFNARFVNLQVDMEKGEGLDIGKRYGVRAYPTFLILHPDGKEQGRVVGATLVARDFIAQVENGMDPKNDLSTLKAEFQSGNMTSERLLDYILILGAAYETDRVKELVDVLLEKLTPEEKLSPAYWPLYSKQLHPVTPEHLAFFLENIATFNKNVGEEQVSTYLEGRCSLLLDTYIMTKQPAEVEELLVILQQAIRQVTTPARESLLSKMEFADATYRGDFDKAARVMEENVALFASYRNALPVLNSFVRVWRLEKSDYSRLKSLTETFMEHADSANAPYFKMYINTFRIRSAPDEAK
jgi:thiol-disulfide isomerase/thioredoxin